MSTCFEQFIFLFHNCVVYFVHDRLCTLFSLHTFLTIIYEHLRLAINQLNAQNLVSSTMCSKHVATYNKPIIKQDFVH